MLSKRWLVSLATAALSATFAIGIPAQATAQGTPTAVLPGTVATSVDVTLRRDGALAVTERVTVPTGEPVHRTIALRQPAGGSAERVFRISGARVEGHGTAVLEGDALAITVRPGVSTLHYVVHGTVADAGEHQEIRWQVAGGWDRAVDRFELSFVSPRIPESINCLAGPVGTTTSCALFRIGHTQTVDVTHFGLRAGDRIDLSAQVARGTVPSNAELDTTFSVDRAFALTPATGAGLAGVGFLMIAGFGLLWYSRGRDVQALSTEVGAVDVLVSDADGTVSFASPDGVLPGQVGTVVDEHVDAVDVSATVIDLAVRNYLWIEELPGEQGSRDWRFVALNDADDALRPYERAVYEGLLGLGGAADGGHREVRLSQLREGAVDLVGVRDALYDDVVGKDWFARRPDAERNLFWWVGVGLGAAGVVLTALLAVTTSLGLLGIAVVIGGVALTFGSRLMPARTARGSTLVAQVRGLRGYLRGVRAERIPAPDREMVFSRALPYAVVLGETEHWLAEFAELDPGADGTPGLYWYGEFVDDAGHVMPNLRRFRAHLPMLLGALEGMLVRAGHLRSLR